jgi:bacterioferritin
MRGHRRKGKTLSKISWRTAHGPSPRFVIFGNHAPLSRRLQAPSPLAVTTSHKKLETHGIPAYNRTSGKPASVCQPATQNFAEKTMKGDKKIIDILNELLAGELTAVDQYLIHGEMYADLGLQQLAEKALHESEHERQHARALIQRILFLEGKPDLTKREGLKIGKNVLEMLKSDLAVEYKVVGDLKKAIAACEKAQDYVTREMLRVQLDDTEVDHAYYLEKQLKLVELVGQQNYLQSQMGSGSGA